jgi:hypothetical protein
MVLLTRASSRSRYAPEGFGDTPGLKVVPKGCLGCMPPCISTLHPAHATLWRFLDNFFSYSCVGSLKKKKKLGT